MLLNIPTEQQEDKKAKTEKVLQNIYMLPSIPAIMIEVSRLLDNPASSTAAIAKIIGKDQGLATRLLSTANSALYGLPRKVSTLEFALLVIGYQDTKNIVVALSLMEAFKNKSDQYLNYSDVWIHAFMVAGTAKKLASELGMKNANELFVAGLLHDIGVPVIHKYMHSSFLSIINHLENSESSFYDSEIATLGLSHQEIGGFLAEKWNLPANLCEILKNHHTPLNAGMNKTAAAIVHLSDYAINLLSPKNIWERGITLNQEALNLTGIHGEAQLINFIEELKPSLEQEAQILKY